MGEETYTDRLGNTGQTLDQMCCTEPMWAKRQIASLKAEVEAAHKWLYSSQPYYEIEGLKKRLGRLDQNWIELNQTLTASEQRVKDLEGLLVQIKRDLGLSGYKHVIERIEAALSDTERGKTDDKE